MPNHKPSLGEVLQDGDARKRVTEALLSHAKQQGTKVEYTYNTVGGYFDPKGDQGKPLVAVAKHLEGTDEGLSTLAHELGHAEFEKSPIGRVVRSGTLRSLAGAAPLIGVVIAHVAEGNAVRRALLSASAVAAMQVPLLADEGVAWMKGHRLMKEHGATPQQLKHLRSEALRLGSTYLQPGAMGMGTSLLISALHGAADEGLI